MWLREDGTPYYIGKGSGKRAFTGDSHSVKCPKNSSRIQVQEWPDEATAFAYERYLIDFWGRKDLGTGCLRNKTDGGENPPKSKMGKYQPSHSEKTKMRISCTMKSRGIKPSLQACRISGRKAVESGQLRAICAKGGSVGGRINARNLVAWCKNNGQPWGKIQGPILARDAVESGRIFKIGKHGLHVRWHVQRNIINPKCQECQLCG